MASKPLCLEVVRSNLGNPSEFFALVRANEGYEWEMMEQVNAGFFMETLQSNKKLIEFLDVSDASTLARTNSLYFVGIPDAWAPGCCFTVAHFDFIEGPSCFGT